ncbi:MULTISPECIES: DUF4238 domain-containing protein [Agrobacterium tumefaciens complex]|uniref:DUF4238 domain-containing protein n=1 Tax=Agrobacterium tomkonis CFBP 6623 TaxID=1183432 RepID=A0A1S7S2J8_9HYPH|nr:MULTISPECIES: DUF4238 domain-containing protein [Agrobacterium tumefaciens complex]CUX61698.1 conserved hypothetical protein [Agrobacterium tomkonis CFBP 6623]
MNTPTNHHYVPQHFLAAWSQDGRLVSRYVRIAHTGKLHFRKGAGIVNLGSENDLYVIENTDGRAEFETTIVTALLDTPGAEIVKKARETGIRSLSSEERRTFSHYVVMLEMRNPRTIALMSLSEADVGALHAGQNAVSGDTVGAREAARLLSSIHTGKTAAGLGIANDFTFSDILFGCPPIAFETHAPRLLSSNYPVGRVGSYERNFLVGLALSPTSGLFWCSQPALTAELEKLTIWQQATFLNFLTLGRAEVAFTDLDIMDTFVDEHLGWQIRLDESSQKEKLAAMLGKIKETALPATFGAATSK